MARGVAAKNSDIAGDGTTTATVLAQAIFREGLKSVAAGMNPMDLKRGVDLAVKAVVAHIEKRARKVQSHEEIATGEEIVVTGVDSAYLIVRRAGATPTD